MPGHVRAPAAVHWPRLTGHGAAGLRRRRRVTRPVRPLGSRGGGAPGAFPGCAGGVGLRARSVGPLRRFERAEPHPVHTACSRTALVVVIDAFGVDLLLA
jgi:hypothetical protein